MGEPLDSDQSNTGALGSTADLLFWWGAIDQEEAARFIRLSSRRPEGLRREGTGPQYIRFSGRCVRYRRVDLREWAEDRLRTSTSDPDGASAPTGLEAT